jgi:hypothetical protein
MLLFENRPVALELVYKTEAPRWLIANGVQAGYDPAFLDFSVGSILFHHNLERLEDEAIAGDRMLRYSLGWSDAPYKAEWAVDEPVWRVRSTKPLRDAGGEAMAFLQERRDAATASGLWRAVSSDLRRRARRAANAFSRVAARDCNPESIAEADASALLDRGTDE